MKNYGVVERQAVVKYIDPLRASLAGTSSIDAKQAYWKKMKEDPEFLRLMRIIRERKGDNVHPSFWEKVFG